MQADAEYEFIEIRDDRRQSVLGHLIHTSVENMKGRSFVLEQVQYAPVVVSTTIVACALLTFRREYPKGTPPPSPPNPVK